ncbi:unnamed protein product [Paramecium octaurelia]|uniref:Uncharacterized protein n=1 Tax=Paramecium octaurelia TaxID=43137 RepID=A0A8S1UF82_PAROT|nr:unnamed protein product [Paramecium octaurelia]
MKRVLFKYEKQYSDHLLKYNLQMIIINAQEYGGYKIINISFIQIVHFQSFILKGQRRSKIKLINPEKEQGITRYLKELEYCQAYQNNMMLPFLNQIYFQIQESLAKVIQVIFCQDQYKIRLEQVFQRGRKFR